ncbi:glycosyltransferase family 4 protein [Paenibacillus sp. SYP-B4298]|uniref:glycosyltransferase family 4 protein n=1 Tax=Paenibacillus sp. SYP-B4298 TaxID=2996034 RepID=UPI0022DE56F9|nr:glycosyltransferase family 4 protein [Paenibacillus sp. SYP-B4298]
MNRYRVLIMSLKNPVRKYKIGGQQDILGRVLSLSRMAGFELDVIAIDDHDQCSQDSAIELPSNVRLHLYPKRLPLQCLHMPIASASRFHRRIARYLKDQHYDIAICESEFMYPYWQQGLVQAKLNYLRLHNIESEYYRQFAQITPSKLRAFAYRLDAWRLSRWERRGFREFNRLLFISERERQQFHSGFGALAAPEEAMSSLTSLASRGEHLPAAFPLSVHRNHTEETLIDGPRLLTFGDYTLEVNQDGIRWFLEQAWPLVLQQLPGAELTIFGNGSEQWGSYPNVRALGYVERSGEVLRQFSTIIVPLRYGAGVKIKLIEALLDGKSVITTSVGIDGTDLQHQEHILVADEPHPFAEQVLWALTHRSAAQQLAAHGRHYAERWFSIEGHYAVLRRILEDDLGVVLSGNDNPQQRNVIDESRSHVFS